MEKLTTIAVVAMTLLVSLLSCGENNQQVEKDYIKSLEEKNATLQKELDEEWRQIQNLKEKNALLQQDERGTNGLSILERFDKEFSQDRKETNNSSDYFTIGSTEKKVIEVMGDPTTIDGDCQFKIFMYGLSQITFRNGRVDGYTNSGNLRIKVKTK